PLRLRSRLGKKRIIFTVVFYGSAIFGCKTVQFCATRCKYGIAEIPSVRNAVRHCENERKNSFLNYESPALTAELQARISAVVPPPSFALRTASSPKLPGFYLSGVR
ncbi:MAG: hypothetical protein DME59_14635, partial [Verrucomicrobia bacterium]